MGTVRVDVELFPGLWGDDGAFDKGLEVDFYFFDVYVEACFSHDQHCLFHC
jgi:hypothetical protein